MQSLAKYRNMYMDVAALMRSGQPAPDLHAHHDLLASHLPASANQVSAAPHFPCSVLNESPVEGKYVRKENEQCASWHLDGHATFSWSLAEGRCCRFSNPIRGHSSLMSV